MLYYIHRWSPEHSKIRGVIQIIHGMGEHGARYCEVAKFFVSKGFHVVASDHRGHGKSVEKIEQLGALPSFLPLIDDEIEITKNLRNEFPDIPLFIWGHSMGSFIAQAHMKELSDVCDGYLISGSCGNRRFMTSIGACVANIVCLINRSSPSPFLKKLIFVGTRDRHETSPDRVENSWLSHENIIVQKYHEDPLCGFVYYAGFYYAFLHFLTQLFKVKDFQLVRKTLPLYLFSGEEDPIGLRGEGVKRLLKFYQKNLSFTNVLMHLYPKGKHEIHNETNKEKVWADMHSWLEHCLYTLEIKG